LTILVVAAFLTGCSSSSDSATSNASNSNVKSSTATPAMNPAASNSAPVVGGAAPPQARPSASTQVGIKPPTKNGR
jgi:hypothetical protein